MHRVLFALYRKEGTEAMAHSETFVGRTDSHVVDHIPVVGAQGAVEAR
jgi:hypothetical protein